MIFDVLTDVIVSTQHRIGGTQIKKCNVGCTKTIFDVLAQLELLAEHLEHVAQRGMHRKRLVVQQRKGDRQDLAGVDEHLRLTVLADLSLGCRICGMISARFLRRGSEHPSTMTPRQAMPALRCCSLGEARRVTHMVTICWNMYFLGSSQAMVSSIPWAILVVDLSSSADCPPIPTSRNTWSSSAPGWTIWRRSRVSSSTICGG